MTNALGKAAGAAALAFALCIAACSGPAAPASSGGAALKTAWGDPNLQGIWTDVYETPLQRPAKYAGREFLSEEEVAALDTQRAAIPRREHREPKGTERDVSGAYNTVFETVKPTGRRTSLVVDPADGRIPPYTEEAQQRMDVYRQFQLALMQATLTCKNKDAEIGRASCRERV